MNQDNPVKQESEKTGQVASENFELFHPESGTTFSASIGILETQLKPSAFLEDIRTQINRLGQIARFPINEKEWEYLGRHPINAIRGAFAGLGAVMRGLVGGGRNDALRHCFWAGQMYRDLDEDVAKEILDNHEFGRNNPEDDLNNAVGRSIGLSNKTANNQTLFDLCVAAANDGRLTIPGSPIPPTTEPTPPIQPPVVQPPPVAEPPPHSSEGRETGPVSAEGTGERLEREAAERAEREARERESREREARDRAEREGRERAEREARERAEREAQEAADRAAQEAAGGPGPILP